MSSGIRSITDAVGGIVGGVGGLVGDTIGSLLGTNITGNLGMPTQDSELKTAEDSTTPTTPQTNPQTGEGAVSDNKFAGVDSIFNILESVEGQEDEWDKLLGRTFKK